LLCTYKRVATRSAQTVGLQISVEAFPLAPDTGSKLIPGGGLRQLERKQRRQAKPKNPP